MSSAIPESPMRRSSLDSTQSSPDHPGKKHRKRDTVKGFFMRSGSVSKHRERSGSSDVASGAERAAAEMAPVQPGGTGGSVGYSVAAGVPSLSGMLGGRHPDTEPAPLSPVAEGKGENPATSAPQLPGTVKSERVPVAPPKRMVPPPGKAELAVTGVKGVTETIFYELRRRGFVVHIALRRTAGTLDLALGLGPKLLAKLGIEEDIPHKREYTRHERAVLAAAAIAVIKRSELPHTDCFLLHEPGALEYLKTHKKPDDITDYFGSGVGMYFDFLEFYTKFLRYPAAAGAVLFVRQLMQGSFKSSLGPIFCVGMALWATLFLEFWKRHNAATALRWGVIGAENDEETKDLVERAGKPQTTPMSKYMVTIPATCVAIYVCILAMLYCIRLSDAADGRYGKDSLWRFWPMVVYSVVPVLCATGYTVLAGYLNEFEGHRTERQRANALTLKMFAFQFVNYFCALFYIGFYLMDMSRLSGMLFSLAVTRQVAGNAMEAGLPLIKQYLKQYMAKRKQNAAAATPGAPAITAGNSSNGNSTSSALTTKGVTAKSVTAGASNSSAKAASSSGVNSFAGAAAAAAAAAGADGNGARSSSKGPWPVAAAVNQAAQPASTNGASTTAVTTTKTATAAAPAPAAAAPADDADPLAAVLGPVLVNEEVLPLDQFCSQLEAPPFVPADEYLEMAVQFGFSTMFAVAFPLAPLMAYVNNRFEYSIDLANLMRARRPCPTVASNIGSWYTCLEAMGFIATLTNCCLMVFMGEAIESYVPAFLQTLLDTTHGKIVLALVFEHMLLAVKFLVADVVDDQPLWVREKLALQEIEQKEQSKQLRMMAHNIKAQQHKLTGISEEAAAKAKAVTALAKIHGESEAWSFGPVWYLPLILLPYAVTGYGFSATWVLPLAAIIVGYMQHKKDKADAGVALGVVTDANVLKLITKELPSWFYDTETERVEWINKILTQMWPMATGAAQAIVKETVEPLIDYYRPKGVTRLGFKKVSLGSVAPKVVGVRTLDTSESCTVIDLELKWAGNAKFVVEVGRAAFPMTITLSNIRFSGKLRAELGPLVPIVPCFGAVAVTFMERPFVDFTFKVGQLDIMSLGPGDMSIATAVSNIIKSVIQGMMLYPKKLVIPILDAVDVHTLANPAPVGVLHLNVVGADKLRKADTIGKSDPYVIIRFGEEIHKTRVINNTLTPRWDEKFDLLVHDKDVQVVTFALFDEDMDKDDPLGNCEVPLSALKDHKKTALNLPLTDTNTGSLLLKLEYIPLQVPKSESDDSDADVVFDMKPGNSALTDDFVATDDDLESMPHTGGTATTAAAQAVSAARSRLGAAMKAVAGAKLMTAVAPEVPPEPQELHDPTDKSMGVLTVMNITLDGVKPARLYCVIQQGNFQRKTAVESKKSDPSWLLAVHMLVRGAKTAQMEIAVMEETKFGKDPEIGRVKLRIPEVVSNDYDLERVWPLLGEKAQGTIKFRAIWTPAAAERS